MHVIFCSTKTEFEMNGKFYDSFQSPCGKNKIHALDSTSKKCRGYKVWLILTDTITWANT